MSAANETRGTRWCVTYRDLRDGSTYAVIRWQGPHEDYARFRSRMLLPGFDWPWDRCTIMDVLPAIRQGLLPESAF